MYVCCGAVFFSVKCCCVYPHDVRMTFGFRTLFVQVIISLCNVPGAATIGKVQHSKKMWYFRSSIKTGDAPASVFSVRYDTLPVNRYINYPAVPQSHHSDTSHLYLAR